MRSEQQGLAVAVGLTHDITADVRRYCDEALPTVDRLLVLRPGTRTGAQSVICGRHAFGLADSASNAERSAKVRGDELVHLFVAAPNAFTFFLGQRQTALGSVRLYEFDLTEHAAVLIQPLLRYPSLSRVPKTKVSLRC